MAKQEKEKQYKVINNMPAGALGLTMPDGKTPVLRQPGASRMCTKEEIWHIFESCKTIQKGHLFIDDKDMVNELNGLEINIDENEDHFNLNTVSKEELNSFVTTKNVTELKQLFQADGISDGTKEKIAIFAREEYKKNGMDAKKVKLIESFTGLTVAVDDE